jgi:hypothetical protein
VRKAVWPTDFCVLYFNVLLPLDMYWGGCSKKQLPTSRQEGVERTFTNGSTLCNGRTAKRPCRCRRHELTHSQKHWQLKKQDSWEIKRPEAGKCYPRLAVPISLPRFGFTITLRCKVNSYVIDVPPFLLRSFFDQGK